MYNTAKFVTIVGFRLDKFKPTPTVIIEFDDGSEIVINEHFCKQHGFKLRDKVTLTISLDSDQTSNTLKPIDIENLGLTKGDVEEFGEAFLKNVDKELGLDE